jgi:hypothetical protein
MEGTPEDMKQSPPAQTQRPSGSEAAMEPRPVALDKRHVGSGKLRDKARKRALSQKALPPLTCFACWH